MKITGFSFVISLLGVFQLNYIKIYLYSTGQVHRNYFDLTHSKYMSILFALSSQTFMPFSFTTIGYITYNVKEMTVHYDILKLFNNDIKNICTFTSTGKKGYRLYFESSLS